MRVFKYLFWVFGIVAHLQFLPRKFSIPGYQRPRPLPPENFCRQNICFCNSKSVAVVISKKLWGRSDGKLSSCNTLTCSQQLCNRGSLKKQDFFGAFISNGGPPLTLLGIFAWYYWAFLAVFFAVSIGLCSDTKASGIGPRPPTPTRFRNSQKMISAWLKIWLTLCTPFISK